MGAMVATAASAASSSVLRAADVSPRSGLSMASTDTYTARDEPIPPCLTVRRRRAGGKALGPLWSLEAVDRAAYAAGSDDAWGPWGGTDCEPPAMEMSGTQTPLSNVTTWNREGTNTKGPSGGAS